MSFDPKDPALHEALKEAVDEAITRWLDRQFTSFGKWSAVGVISMALAGLTYAFFHTGGFKI
jgi:hypothetical protein